MGTLTSEFDSSFPCSTTGSSFRRAPAAYMRDTAAGMKLQRAMDSLARLGNLWVTGWVSALGLSEETVELPARGVEGALLVFPAVMDQWPAVLVDYSADELFGGHLSQRRVLVHVPDNLPAEQPHVVDMVLDGPFRQAGPGKVKKKGHEVCHKFSAGRKILFLAHPTLRPLRKIAAIAAVW